MLDLRQLRCFTAVAEDLHFGRAAHRLGMQPSALGRHIKLLEEHIGAQLFVRTTRHVALSEDGAVFLSGARAVLLVQTGWPNSSAPARPYGRPRRYCASA